MARLSGSAAPESSRPLRSWILGVSLGDERVLRLENRNALLEDSHEIALPSGSVYVQRRVPVPRLPSSPHSRGTDRTSQR